MYKVKQIKAREIIDSRANPTLEVDLFLENGIYGRASIPSGASTGSREAVELRDNDSLRFLGKGVKKAIENVYKIFEELKEKTFNNQKEFDDFLIEKDGTPNKSNLGANTILGLSLSFCKAVSNLKKVPLYKHINSVYLEQFEENIIPSMPIGMFNIMNGGKHANWSTEVQEFMIFSKNRNFQEQLRVACEIFLNLEKLLKSKNLSTNVGNEGGFAPGFNNNEEAIEVILEATEKSGYVPGRDVFLGLDVAASEFYLKETNEYLLKKQNLKLSPIQLSEKYCEWLEKYPIETIEDPFSEFDIESWKSFEKKYDHKIEIVGDDLLVTNPITIKTAIGERMCNYLLVKLNQIGTVSETLEAISIAKKAGWGCLISHRSGETEDVTISHLAIGTASEKIKSGAPSRGERTAKYNELLRISEELQ